MVVSDTHQPLPQNVAIHSSYPLYSNLMQGHKVATGFLLINNSCRIYTFTLGNKFACYYVELQLLQNFTYDCRHFVMRKVLAQRNLLFW